MQRVALLLVVFLAATVTTPRDEFGRPVGTLSSRGQPGKQFVTDCNSITLGYVDSTGTYDSVGRKLAPYSDPGLLFQRSKCPAAKRVYK